MEMRLGYADASGLKKPALWPVYLCFLTFGVLIGLNQPDFSAITVLVSVLISMAVAWLAVIVLAWAFNMGNPDLRAETGGHFAREAVGTGMLFVIPFTVLAVIAQLAFDWNAVMPFASAAVMTSFATAGTEAMKKGARGSRNIIIPSILAFILSTAWMLLVGMLP